MQCPECGTDNRSSVRFCRQCGQRLIPDPPQPAPTTLPPANAAHMVQSTCAHCNAVIKPNARFCPKCGQKVTPDEPSPHLPASIAAPATPIKKVCAVCGAGIKATARFCASCGTAIAPVPDPPPQQQPFMQDSSRYPGASTRRSPKATLTPSSIEKPTYQQSYSASSAVNQQPLREAAPIPVAVSALQSTQGGKKKKAGRRVFLVGCGAVILLFLASVGILIYGGWQGYKESPKIVEIQESDYIPQPFHTLSEEQNEHIRMYSNPEAFTILFYQEETHDGHIETVRLENWDYYTQQKGFTFINGELIAEDTLDISEIGTLRSLPHLPIFFRAFMSLEEVVSATGIDSYIEVPVYNEFMKGGTVYYADSLSFGLKDGKLVYVEVFALSSNE